MTDEIDPEVAAWNAEQARLDALPQILVHDMQGAAILVEAPTGICYVYSPEFNDGPMLRREGFLLPVTITPAGGKMGTVIDAMAQVTYFQNGEDIHPWFEDRPIDPLERVRGIPVRTIYGRGWLFWTGEWGGQ